MFNSHDAELVDFTVYALRVFLIPAVLILPVFFYLDGVIIAGPVADLGASVITGILVTKELRHLEQRQKIENLADFPEMGVSLGAKINIKTDYLSILFSDELTED